MYENTSWRVDEACLAGGVGFAGLGGKAGLDEFPKLVLWFPLLLYPSQLLPLTEALLPAEEVTSFVDPT